MNGVRLRLVLCLAGVVLRTFIAASAQAQYTITDLGAFNATAINSGGQVVGWTESSNGTEAVLYSDGVLTDFGGPGSEAKGINARGQVVGGTGAGQAFLWSNGSMTDLGSGEAYGINNSGQVVGAWGGNAFLYSSGVLKYLMPPPGGLPDESVASANAINNSGQIVGTQLFSLSPYRTATFVYSGGFYYQPITAPFSYASYGVGINDSGQVIGWADTSSTSSSTAFLDSDGTMVDLGTLGNSGSFASGINDEGQVVGDYYTDDSESAFIYTNGSVIDLNSLIPTNSGWTLEDAVGINNSGEIVGNGINPNGDTYAFLLTPVVPEPAGLGLFGFGLLLFRRRRAA